MTRDETKAAVGKLRVAATLPDDVMDGFVTIRTSDLRALLAAYDEAEARGVAAERARVVAWLRAADSETLVWFAAQRIEQGWHDKEGA